MKIEIIQKDKQTIEIEKDTAFLSDCIKGSIELGYLETKHVQINDETLKNIMSKINRYLENYDFVIKLNK